MKGLNGCQVWAGIACLALVLVAGCLNDGGVDISAENETERAIAIALADAEVQENIPVDTGAYEIVDVWPGRYEATGPEGTISWSGTEVTFRVTNQLSIYHVFVDVPNNVVVKRYWQWIKDPMPCMQTGPPEEYFSLEAAAAAPGPATPTPTQTPRAG